MKKIFLLPALASLLLSISDCSPKKKETSRLKGRLEIKGICFNYTIKLIGGTIDTSKIVSSWTDESTGKTHTNVFALSNPCLFPASINEGDEFEFELGSDKSADCVVCEAYYPTPPRSLIIKVLDK